MFTVLTWVCDTDYNTVMLSVHTVLIIIYLTDMMSTVHSWQVTNTLCLNLQN